MIYLNEFDPFAVEWLKGLRDAGTIPNCDIDGRDVRGVKSDEIRHYRQWHLFAGIAGWCEALRLAGWDDSVGTVLTASCPCQPFSVAGKGKGEEDERHLWPAAFALVRELRPDFCFGEQVASAAGYEWLDGVRVDLESSGYAFGAADLPAAGVGAPHIRQRIFWGAVRLADSPPERRRQRPTIAGGGGEGVSAEGRRGGPTNGGAVGGLGDSRQSRLAGRSGERRDDEPQLPAVERAGGDAWSDCRIISCRDGMLRRISSQPGDEPLASGIPRDLGRPRAILESMGYGPKEIKRMLRRPRCLLALAGLCRTGRLKGYGNAIVPQVAAVFVRAFLSACHGEV